MSDETDLDDALDQIPAPVGSGTYAVPETTVTGSPIPAPTPSLGAQIMAARGMSQPAIAAQTPGAPVLGSLAGQTNSDAQAQALMALAQQQAAAQQNQQPPGGPIPAPTAPVPDIPNSALFGAGAPGVAPRPVGMSPADKAYNAQLGAGIQQAQADRDQALGQVGDIARNFSDQTQALVEDSQVAKMAFDSDRKKQADFAQSFQEETKRNASRIRDKLATLEAQGINPNNYWQQAGTASNILSAISVGLGGMAALNAHNGGRNPGLEMLNDAISRDIDAQKTNLQHSLAVVGKESDLDNDSFEHQNALLKAETESTQTAYQLAQNQLAKHAAMYKDNADVQTNAQKLSAGLNESLGSKIEDFQSKQWQLAKNAEKMTGVGGAASQITPKMIGDATIDLIKKGIPAEDARRQAIISFMGKNFAPGSPEKTVQGAAGKASVGRGAAILMREGSQLDAAEAAATELHQLASNGSNLSPTTRGRMAALSQQLDAAGFKNQITSPGLTGANPAQAAQILQAVRNRKAALANRLAEVQRLGGAATGADEAEDTGAP
jgi:hypothetical protein